MRIKRERFWDDNQCKESYLKQIHLGSRVNRYLFVFKRVGYFQDWQYNGNVSVKKSFFIPK